MRGIHVCMCRNSCPDLQAEVLNTLKNKLLERGSV